jgi:SAM-dependent methyltransferase
MTEKLVGCVDSIDSTSVSGWVLETIGTRTFPVPELRVNGKATQKLRLTGSRPDVTRVYQRAAAGIYAEISDHLAEETNLVEIVFPENGLTLANGTKTVRIARHAAALDRELRSVNERLSTVETHFEQLRSLLSLKGQVLSIPPKHLQVRVSGDFYPGFFDHGKRMFADVERILATHGYTVSGFSNILDFGCGCGRFLIPLGILLDPGRLSGTDIDAEAVNWLQNHSCNFADLDVNKPSPPTKYGDGSFDFVFSISIFTHLPEDMQHAWLQELARIIKPGGLGLFTTHGEKFYHGIPEEERDSFLKKGFYYRVGPTTEGLPDFYQSSFHTPAYIRREWSRHFDVLAIESRGIDGHQDAVLVRRRDR